MGLTVLSSIHGFGVCHSDAEDHIWYTGGRLGFLQFDHLYLDSVSGIRC